MSKQVALKFKKLIKQAEFVHADLEYHEELSIEAKNLFREAVQDAIEKLSPEQKEAFNELISKQQKQMQEQLLKQQKEREEKADKNETVEKPDTEQSLEDHPDVELIPEVEEQQPPAPARKLAELKRLFHRIAAETHPDKSAAKGLKDSETRKLESLFKQAKTAYQNENWYILYSIATQLDLEVKDISEDHLEWIESDIRSTLGKISQIGNLVAWGWYVGDETRKQTALKYYFEQIYGFSYPFSS